MRRIVGDPRGRMAVGAPVGSGTPSEGRALKD
jgi:hypothetical protein